jgi:saccharopine dehydrogenase-like NADP-dependent oxidoreductase
MANITVLGSGMVGRAMALDLAKKHRVTAADISEDALQRLAAVNSGIRTTVADLRQESEIKKLVSDADVVVGSVPGFMGFEMMRQVIDAGKNIVDISFYPENPFALDALARQRNVIAIMDMGVAPGISNLLLGYHHKQHKVLSFECLVGGLPAERRYPFEYKAPFSAIDVIEEYLRPARFVVNGKQVVKPALSDPELIDFPGIGTLEAFNSDGLRSLVETIPVADMIERTLRYPGHIALMRAFREAGFFSKEDLLVSGVKLEPIDCTSKLLFEQWRLGDHEEEFTVMRLRIVVGHDGGTKTLEYFLLDRFDKATATSSMARTTGYTCTAGVELILEGKYNRPGISPPEFIGEDEACVQFVMNYLRERGVKYQFTESDSNPG